MAKTKKDKKGVRFSSDEDEDCPDQPRKANGGMAEGDLQDLHDPAKLTRPISTVQVYVRAAEVFQELRRNIVNFQT